MRKISRLGVTLAALAGLGALVAPVASADPHRAGLVFTSTNAASGNAVLVYKRAGDGTLSALWSVPTGGLGTGGGLGSQGALALSRDGHRLFVVNAGSNSISELAVSRAGVTLLATVPSDGVDPISLTVNDDLLYVLNEGGPGSPANISGFRIGEEAPSPIAGSTRPLSAASVGAAQISFDPSGDLLVVTEKATSLIDTYTIGENGRAQGPASQPSAGQTPFGFAFDRRGELIVSDAFGGASNAGALSSYEVSEEGSLSTISGPTADSQSAPCWVVITANGRYAFTTNTGSGSISSYAIGHDGSITLLASVSGSTGSGSAPIDAALSGNSRYLYVLGAGSHAIAGFRVESDGSLAPLAGGPAGLPAGAVGLVAG